MAKTREQLEASSTKDLKALAGKLDIEGRSRLDKAGLVDAIEAAQGSSEPQGATTSGKLHASAEAIRDDQPEGPTTDEVAASADGIEGAPVEITDANDVELSQPVNRSAGRVDVQAGTRGAQEEAGRAALEATAEGEGPVVGFATKAAAPAPADIPGTEVDPRRHVPYTQPPTAAAPPAPTRFDGTDSGAQQ